LHYREALDTDAVLRVVAQHHNKPANWTRGEQVPFKITGVNVIWRDVSSLQAETSLMNMDAAGLRKVLKLIEQRGWKDYIHVEYEENK
jgi:hypothetical protein